MKKVLKKLFISFAVSAVVCSNVFAFDYGATISNNTKFKSTEDEKFSLNQYDFVSLWVKAPIGQDANKYIAAEGLYEFKYKKDTNKMYNYLDLNLLKFAYLKTFDSGVLNLSVGRFFAADSTGVIFAQNADGVYASYEALGLNVSLYGAYTGLLNGNIVEMCASPDFEGVDESKIYSLADKNVVAMVTATAKNMFKNQTLSAQFLASFGIAEKTYNRIYGTLGIGGPIVGKLLYDAKATCAFISYNGKTNDISLFAKANLGYYFDNASVNANVVFAGKDFNTVTNIVALNSVSEPGYSNLLKAGLSGTYKPISNVLLSASFDCAFDGYDNFAFKGIQYGVGCDYQVKSDVYVGATWGQYFDINKTDLDCNNLSIKAKISL